MARQKETWSSSPGFQYTVASYNLADSSCTLNAGEKGIRQDRLYTHIIDTGADIVCLQNVRDWNFWKTHFLVKKFGGWWKRRAMTSYGCCIFSKTSRFVEVARKFISDEECEQHIAQILVLKDLTSTPETLKQNVLICNIQTDSDRGVSILEQLEEVFNQMEEYAGEQKSIETHDTELTRLKPRVLICGNMNFIPESYIGNFIRSGIL